MTEVPMCDVCLGYTDFYFIIAIGSQGAEIVVF